MSNKQTTIKKQTTLEGVGIHTGNKVKLTFKPATADFGYVFKRIDMINQPEIEALSKYVVDTQRGTTLEKDGVKLKTIEHVLAALVGLEIDNVIIEINGEEPPILDGSSKYFVEALEGAGIKFLNKIRSEYIVNEVISYVDKKTGSEITVIPSDNYQITTMVDYDTKILGTQNATLNNLKEFKENFSNARTFSFLHEIEMLLENNLIKGGDLNNAIVYVDKKISDETMDKLKKQKDIYDKKAIMDADDIMNILPHRPPFLFVDKILEISDTSITGLKYVSPDETYFKGHFPGRPVMPGVLQIEAMAQVGGVLVLSTFPDPENYLTFFARIENAKFKRTVVPGDVLIFKLELLSPIRRGISHMIARAYVNGELTTEAEMKAKIVEK